MLLLLLVLLLLSYFYYNFYFSCLHPYRIVPHRLLHCEVEACAGQRIFQVSGKGLLD